MRTYLQMLPANKVYTLVIALFFIANSVFAQQAFPARHTCLRAPNSSVPGGMPHYASSVFRSADVCDTSAVIDYNTYDELIATNNNLNYDGSWNNPAVGIYAQEITSYVDTFHNYMYTYAGVIWDSLTFANYAEDETGYDPRAQSTIYLDSLILFAGIWGDTTQVDGLMTHDSLVFTIFPVSAQNTLGPPVKTVVLSGYSGLEQFFHGTNIIGIDILPVEQQFAQGEGFAITVSYMAKDTSSHFELSYSFADSCGQEGAAYPTMFQHDDVFAQIQPTGEGANAEAVNLDNTAAYSIPGLPPDCSYVYTQNWELLPMINVCVNYDVQIQSSPTTICDSSITNLSANVFGTSSSNITYSWYASSGTFTDASSQSTSLVTNTNSNVTVSVTANDGMNGPVTNSIVLINCHPQPLIVSAGTNDTVCNGSSLILTPTLSGGVPPFNYTWQSTGSALNCPACENPSVSITQNSVYSLTVTDANQDTATASVSYYISATTSQLQLSLSNTPVNCLSQMDTTIATITGGNPPYTFNWGDGNTQTGGSPQTHNYSQSGQQIVVITDATGCVISTFDTVPYGGITVSLLQATQPLCPNGTNDTVIVSVTGGTPPYLYYWNNGTYSDSLVNVPTGSYSLWVSDAASCIASFNYILNPVLDVNYYVYLTETDANCNTQGSIVASVYGGIPPYLYSWNTSASTSYINPINPGNYSLTVTDSAGCQASGNSFMNSACFSIISGLIFSDTNNNCSYDTGEQGVPNIFVTANSASGNYYYGFTDQNGQYSIQVEDTGIYTISTFNWGYESYCANITLCGNANQTVYLPVLGDSSVNNNFSYTSSSGFDIALHPGWTSADPGFEKDYWIFYYNESPLPYNDTATVAFKYDSNLVFIGSDIPYTYYDAAADSLTWAVNSFGFGWNEIGYIRFNVPATLSLSYELQSQFWIYPFAGDCDTSNNYFYFSDLVTGSHDPNEKDVQPAGNLTEKDSALTYTIHFQNTGTDSTHFIIVKDTLSPNLDPATVRNIASSYKYSDFTVSGTGILTWTFNPYRLVDSITNPSGSKGFITFTVKEKKNLPLGTTISNTASVYFDYNTPVVTNTVTDTVAHVVSISEVSGEPGITIKVFPNPFNDETNFIITGLNQKFDFELFDLTGRVERKISSIQNNQFELERSDLPAGVYLYRISVNGKQVGYGKLEVD